VDKRLLPYKYGKIEDIDDDAFEAEFWSKASDEMKFEYVEQLVITAQELQGKGKNELRLQRSIGSFQQQSR